MEWSSEPLTNHCVWSGLALLHGDRKIGAGHQHRGVLRTERVSIRGTFDTGTGFGGHPSDAGGAGDRSGGIQTRRGPANGAVQTLQSLLIGTSSGQARFGESADRGN
jgi:hypothetical protein